MATPYSVNANGILRVPPQLDVTMSNKLLQIDNKHSGQKMPMRSDACPMRGIQDRDFLYIFNAWSYSDAIYYNNNEGLTMQAMQRASKHDPLLSVFINRNKPKQVWVFTH